MSLIELKNISKIFGFADATTVALDDVNLAVDEGEFVVVIGPSGSGKSTLLSLVGLLDEATYGDYLLDGQIVSSMRNGKRAKIRREQIGFIFQSASLLPDMTVIDNVALPLQYGHVSLGKRRERAIDLLRDFAIDKRAYYMPSQLSGGQLQTAAIARALINSPSVILADEPTGNLDSKATDNIMNTFKSLHASGNTIIMVTHNLDLVRYADRVIGMVDGKIHNDDVDLSTFRLPDARGRTNDSAEDRPNPTTPIKKADKTKKSRKSKKQTRKNK